MSCRLGPQIVVALVLGCAASVWATNTANAANTEPKAATATGTQQIREITIEGLRRVEREAALAGIKSTVGSAFDEAQLTRDLRAVWKTGFFRDARVEKQHAADGWHITFVVAERPSIHELKYLGRKNLSEDDIKGVVDIKPYTILNIDALKRNTEKIKDLYVQKGYYLADVKYHYEPVGDSKWEVDVYFDIVENAKVLVKEIMFVGNKHLSTEYLKGGLQTREGGELSWITQTGTYKEDYFQTDMLRIQAAYYDQGFVTVKVGEPVVTLSPDRRFVYLSVSITEGEKYNVGRLAFSGDVVLRDAAGKTIVDEARLRKILTISSGEVFNRTKLFADISMLTDVYRDQGYAFANVTPNSSIRADVKEVDLDLSVERGDLVYFERIDIVGNVRTRDSVIRRELNFVEGERYSASAINISKAQATALGFFETVNITTTRGSRPDRMNVRVEVKEKATGSFQIAAGLSSVENFILQAQVSQNNFLGNGWLVALSAQISFGDYARKIATLQFYNPYFLDSNWSLGADAYSNQRVYPEFQRDSLGIAPRLGYPIADNVRLSTGYTLERLEITTGSSDVSGQALHGMLGKGINSAVNASLSYDTRDNRLFPSAGQYHSLSGELSHPNLGTSLDFAYWRSILALRYYHHLPWSWVLKLNAELGLVGGIDGRTAPIGERFYPGGIESVRGFESRGLGPTISTLTKGSPSSPSSAFIYGGNKQAVFNLEIEIPLVEAANVKGVLFIDAGNAFNDDQNFFYIDTPKELQPRAYLSRGNREILPPLGLFYSYGAGLRWFSPIGPLRFEWGFPITKPARDSRNMIFEFTIGSFF